MIPTRSYRYVVRFRCLQQDCPDTCCAGWSMPSDARQRERFAATNPALLDSLDDEGMFKQCTNERVCVHFAEGQCGLHRRYGEAMLSDSCHFYPRTLRLLNDGVRMAAMLSCPETVRLLLSEAAPFALEETPTDARLQHVSDAMLAQRGEASLTDFFISKAGAPLAPAIFLRRLIAAASLPLVAEDAAWHDVDAALPASRVQPTNPQMLLYTLALLMATSPPMPRARLDQTFATMEESLHCRMDWGSRIIQPAADSLQASAALHVRWQTSAASSTEEILRRWIQAQLAVATFPHGGVFARNVAEGVQFLCVRFALIRLALMCHMGPQGEGPDEDTTIRVIQSIARLVDHTADHELLRSICRDAGWGDVPGLLGLLEV